MSLVPPSLFPLAQTAAERLAAARDGLDIPMTERLIGLLGIAVMLGIAVLLSSDRKKIDWRLVGTGVGLQALFGVLVLKTELGRTVFARVGEMGTVPCEKPDQPG